MMSSSSLKLVQSPTPWLMILKKACKGVYFNALGVIAHSFFGGPESVTGTAYNIRELRKQEHGWKMGFSIL